MAKTKKPAAALPPHNQKISVSFLRLKRMVSGVMRSKTVQSNPHQHFKVRPLELSDYVKEEISRCLVMIRNVDNVQHVLNRHGFAPVSDDIQLLCAIKQVAALSRRFALNDLERGELIGLS